MIPNVLASRYASPGVARIWSPAGKIRMEREYWIAVLKAQAELGLPISTQVIQDYEAVLDSIDLASIEQRERITRHDVKARIEAFNELAGHEDIHKGMTSRDLTENVEQLQLFRTLQLLLLKSVACLDAFSQAARMHQNLLISGRTHNVAAQPTTLGKRIAMFGEELLYAVERLRSFLGAYPARGLKGAVGTQLDMLTLFDGDSLKVERLEASILRHLGLPEKWDAVGQVYPRSLDFETVSLLNLLAAGPSSFARTLRLMAGHELASEGFAKGQVGSSAMPHKMNARSCERINGFATILKGHLTMASGISGEQWNEGDVSCSVVRRVVLPDACFAVDGLLETTLTILSQMEVFPAVIHQENERYFPFLCSTTILMEAVKAGAGREQAHEAIKEHAVATAAALRSGESPSNDLFLRLSSDSRIPLDARQLQGILDAASTLAGKACDQVDAFAQKVQLLLDELPEARSISPSPLL